MKSSILNLVLGLLLVASLVVCSGHSPEPTARRAQDHDTAEALEDIANDLTAGHAADSIAVRLRYEAEMLKRRQRN